MRVFVAPNDVAITAKKTIKSMEYFALHAAYTIVPLEGGSTICVVPAS